MNAFNAALAELMAIDNKRYEAMVARDVTALEGLLADELLYTHSTGNTDTKEQYIETIRSGYVQYRSSQVDDLVFRQRGDVGMLMGRARIEATIGGADRLLENRFFACWAKAPLSSTARVRCGFRLRRTSPCDRMRPEWNRNALARFQPYGRRADRPPGNDRETASSPGRRSCFSRADDKR
ncbi:MAG: nuclear transport factor 2 family protein [Paraburkholderia sp.]|jgi:ketosteroid isomerase-like protein